MPKLQPKSVKLARQLRSSMTEAERELWHALRLRQLGVKFPRQHPVGSYIVDFACIECMLCIEVDVAQPAERAACDEARSNDLRYQGYTVLRFTDREVLTALDSVKEAIWNALQMSRPPPSPPSP